MSPRSAATATCATAWVNTSPWSVPVGSGAVGSVGYSSTGIISRLNRDDPQVTCTLLPSATTSMGLAGRLREMSASSRPRTRTRPDSATSAGTVTFADTS